MAFLARAMGAAHGAIAFILSFRRIILATMWAVEYLFGGTGLSGFWHGTPLFVMSSISAAVAGQIPAVITDLYPMVRDRSPQDVRISCHILRSWHQRDNAVR